MSTVATDVKVRLIFVGGYTLEVDGVTTEDVDRWTATNVITYRNGDARMIHPMSAIATIVVVEE